MVVFLVLPPLFVLAMLARRLLAVTAAAFVLVPVFGAIEFGARRTGRFEHLLLAQLVLAQLLEATPFVAVEVRRCRGAAVGCRILLDAEAIGQRCARCERTDGIRIAVAAGSLFALVETEQRIGVVLCAVAIGFNGLASLICWSLTEFVCVCDNHLPTIGYSLSRKRMSSRAMRPLSPSSNSTTTYLASVSFSGGAAVPGYRHRYCWLQ